jgi:hypothetical protein
MEELAVANNADIREHASFLKDIAPSPARSLSAALVMRF